MHKSSLILGAMPLLGAAATRGDFSAVPDGAYAVDPGHGDIV